MLYKCVEAIMHHTVFLSVTAFGRQFSGQAINYQVIWKKYNCHVVHSATYSRVQNSKENFVVRPKMAIFRRAGMREGGLPLPLAFQ